MEAAIQAMVKVYLKSTKGKESLGKKEFQSLVSTQLSNILTDTDSKEAVNNMGQQLDANQDGKVGFEEYMKLVGYLAVSLSEQRNASKEDPAQNAASGQVAQSAPDKEEEKPEAKAEAKEEPKAEATTEVKVDANADAKVEVKAEGETQPEVAKEEPAAAAEAAAAEAEAAAAAAAAGAGATAVEVVTKVVEVAGNEEVKVEEAVEKLPVAVEEEVEKKIDEATS